jgi:hypothetical protein
LLNEKKKRIKELEEELKGGREEVAAESDIQEQDDDEAQSESDKAKKPKKKRLRRD